MALKMASTGPSPVVVTRALLAVDAQGQFGGRGTMPVPGLDPAAP